jgi:single-strand DNA-binding protein
MKGKSGKMAVNRTRTATPPRMATPLKAVKEPAKPAEPKPPVKPKETERIPGSLAGNLTFDPELRFTATGREVATLNVAINDRVKNDETGQWEDTEAEFYRINVWGQQATHVAECFQRGDRIVAVGYFQDRTWENRDGEEVTTTEFTASDIGPSLLFQDAVIKRVNRQKGK